MSQHQDHFSAIAGDYARGRFGYPDSLFDALAGFCRTRGTAWDCGTGNGQAAASLATRFHSVVATDISETMLARVPILPNVTYRCASAENSEIESASIDLVTVAQSLHWFDLELFWPEVERVCRPEAVFAFWGYVWPHVNDAVDARLAALRVAIAPYWPERSALLQDGYRGVHPPFAEIACPALSIVAEWQRQDYLTHAASWAAVRYYRERHGGEILAEFDRELKDVWPDDCLQTTRWPLIFRAFKVSSICRV